MMDSTCVVMLSRLPGTYCVCVCVELCDVFPYVTIPSFNILEYSLLLTGLLWFILYHQ